MPYIGNIVQDFSVNTAMLNTDSVTSIKIDDGTIVNADINASAAIAGSKISPTFTTDGRFSLITIKDSYTPSDVNKKINISKNVFHPKPKVDSSLIEINLKKNNRLKNLEIFSKIVKKSFYFLFLIYF